MLDIAAVIMPGSIGLSAQGNRNEEFSIESISYIPSLQGLVYRGKYNSNIHRDTGEAKMISLVPIQRMQIIQGLSKLGYYDLESGEIIAEDEMRSRLLPY